MRDNPCSLTHAGASSPQLLGESVEANGMRAGASVPCGYETVVAGIVTISFHSLVTIPTF